MCMYSKPVHEPGCKCMCLTWTLAALLCTLGLVILSSSFFPLLNCHGAGNPARFRAAYWRQTIKPLADINGRDENPGAISAGTAWWTCLCLALHLQQHLSLSIIWLLSQQINQITAPGLCAAAPIAPASCISFEMYEVYILSLLFI